MRNAFAAATNCSAAASSVTCVSIELHLELKIAKSVVHFSCRPPKKLKPPDAFCSEVSACCNTSISVICFVAESEKVPHLTKQRSWVACHFCVRMGILGLENLLVIPKVKKGFNDNVVLEVWSRQVAAFQRQ